MRPLAPEMTAPAGGAATSSMAAATRVAMVAESDRMGFIRLILSCRGGSGGLEGYQPDPNWGPAFRSRTLGLSARFRAVSRRQIESHPWHPRLHPPLPLCSKA